MNAGDVVYNEYHGIRRYGVVTKTYIKPNQGCHVPWTYARVKWFNDEAYDSCVERTDRLRSNGDESNTIRLSEYRVDKIRKIDLAREIDTLVQIQQFKESI